MIRLAILDYGMGNLRSVEKALERVGAEAFLTPDPDAARTADGVVLPGVGAFPAAMRRVRELGLDALVTERLSAGIPVLGICLGLQLLFERSTERGGAEGLGLVPGEVTGLEAPGLKVPHIGWEPVRWERSSELSEGLSTETPFYFVHSFAVRPGADTDVLGTAEWGERFACAVSRPPLYGVQFHPEKSSAAGLRLLANFTEICASVLASILYPAIDIRGGHAVRLLRGDYDRETVYDAEPLDAARRWQDQGASFLHVVDLDGARSGHPENLEHVKRIAAGVEVPIQLGGGLRDAEAVSGALAAGAKRVILGTAALVEPGLVAALVAEHGERIVVGIDARSGQVAVEGWERETAATPVDLMAELAGRGVAGFVYTPVEVDGTLEGPGLDGLAAVAARATDLGATLLYSGGIGSLDDLRRIASLGADSVAGVIVGRALYEGRFTVAEGQAALSG